MFSSSLLHLHYLGISIDAKFVVFSWNYLVLYAKITIFANKWNQMKLRNRFSVILVIVIICQTLYIYNKVGKRGFGHKVVVCIPVYGQSYALGEEAVRITDLDSLRIKYSGRIVTEHMGHIFGYFDHSSRYKQYLKRLLHYDKKAFELSVYSMAEYIPGRSWYEHYSRVDETCGSLQ